MREWTVSNMFQCCGEVLVVAGFGRGECGESIRLTGSSANEEAQQIWRENEEAGQETTKESRMNMVTSRGS